MEIRGHRVRSATLRRGVISAPQFVPMRARGDSMLPTIHDGDWLFVAPNAPVRTGDVAVIRRDGTVVVHRVISRRLGLEMGDAARRANQFDDAGIVGRVVGLARGDDTVDMTALTMRLRGGFWTARGITKVTFRRVLKRST